MHASSPNKPRPPRLLLVVGLAGLLLASDARADEVVLKSGKTRTGEVVSQDDRFVILKTKLGRIRIPASEVVEVRQGDEVEQPAEDGSTEPPAPPERPAEFDPPPQPAGDDDGAGGEKPTTEEVEAAKPTVVFQAVPAHGDDSDGEASDRLKRLRASRVIRRTTAPEAEDTGSDEEEPVEATIGGRVLGKVPQGTELIVFQPPRVFESAPGAIEIGRRTLARMEMAGKVAAWLSTAGAGGEQRIAIRLSDVKRHVEVTTPEARLRLFEGINTGDWVRVRTTSGMAVEGRLDGAGNGVVNLDTIDREEGVKRAIISLEDIVTVDGVIRDTAAELALTDVSPGELMAVTFWPSGDQVMGRHVESPPGLLALDLDDDGTADRTILREGPLAEVRRIPAVHRELAVILRPGNVVRVTYRDDYDDAAVRRTTLGVIEALTAFALSIRHENEAVVVPFDTASELVLIEDDPEEEIRLWHTRIPKTTAAEDLAVLPGMPAKEAARLPLEDGITTLSDGLMVTHVFISAPFAGEMFGIRIGEPVSQSTRRSSLRFDTRILPRIRPDAPPEPRQLISESIEGLRIVLLADGLGVVTGIEISAAD